MNRRELLQAAALMTVSHRVAFAEFKIEPKAKYVGFVNPMLMGPDFAKKFMADNPGSVIYEIDIAKGQTLDDAIRLFRD